MGHPARRRFGDPVLAAVVAVPAQAAAAARRTAVERRGRRRSTGGLHPGGANPGRFRGDPRRAHSRPPSTLPAENFLVEPRAASTGPALVWATLEAARRDPEATVISMHADWIVRDPAAFVATAATALDTADPPSPAGDGRHRSVAPGDRIRLHRAGRAARLGGARGGAVRREARRRPRARPDGRGCALEQRTLRLARGRPPPRSDACTPTRSRRTCRCSIAGDVAGFFRDVREVSIDVGVFERSDSVAVVAGDFAWDDIGTWEALARVRPRDRRGNVTHGPVTLVDCSDCIVWNDGPPMVLSGVHDLVVVHANDADAGARPRTRARPQAHARRAARRRARARVTMSALYLLEPDCAGCCVGAVRRGGPTSANCAPACGGCANGGSGRSAPAPPASSHRTSPDITSCTDRPWLDRRRDRRARPGSPTRPSHPSCRCERVGGTRRLLHGGTDGRVAPRRRTALGGPVRPW